MVETPLRTVAVLGATGAQGGSVVRALLKNKSRWAVRALTRNPDSAGGKELKALGAEVVACDINNKSDLERAFTDVYAVFAVTFFLDNAKHNAGKPEFEVEQGMMIADVAKAMKIQHLVWSSLDNVEGISKGKLSSVYHFTSKFKVEQYIRQLGIPASFFYAAFYMKNFFSVPGFMLVKSSSTDTWELRSPIPADLMIPYIDTDEDTGKIVVAMLENPEKVLGQIVHGVSENLTYGQIAESISKFTGKKVLYKYIGRPTMEDLEKMNFIEREMAEMFMWFEDYGYYNRRDTSDTAKLVPNLNSFKTYLQRTQPQLA